MQAPLYFDQALKAVHYFEFLPMCSTVDEFCKED